MKKIIFGIFVLALIVGIGFSRIARAEDEGRGDDRDQKSEAHKNGSTLEVHIYDDGKVLVRGAKVTSVSGTTVNAVTTWGSVNMAWAINTDSKTKMIRRYGGQSMLSEISVGDFVSFKGNLVNTVASPVTVQAQILKDWSIQKKNATISGSVSSIDATAQSFVVAAGERGDVTVKVTSSTKIVKGDATMTFADIIVGAKVSAE